MLPRVEPAQVGLATEVYHTAAGALLEGGNPYAVTPPGLSGYAFLYPPIVLVVLLPYGFISSQAAFLLQTILNFVSTAVLAVLLLRTIEGEGISLETVDQILIVGFTFLSVWSVTNFLNGQVNPFLALGIAVGAILLDRGKDRVGGVVFALVAIVKLFPALFGAWLLRLRAWRAIIVSLGTGIGLFVLGAVVLGPDLTVTYLTEALPREASATSFAGRPDPSAPQLTIRRQLAFLAPGLSSGFLVAIGAALVAPVVLAASRSVATVTQRLVALQATLLAVLVLFPFEPFYLSLSLFPLVPLLYLLERQPGWRLFLAGMLLLAMPITMSTVSVWVGQLPIPPETATIILAIAESAFAFALPPMYGVWLVLAGCVMFQHRQS